MTLAAGSRLSNDKFLRFLAFSIISHILFLVLAATLPKMFNKRVYLPSVYEVDLVDLPGTNNTNAMEAASPPPPPPKESQVAKEAQTLSPKEIISESKEPEAIPIKKLKPKTIKKTKLVFKKSSKRRKVNPDRAIEKAIKRLLTTGKTVGKGSRVASSGINSSSGRRGRGGRGGSSKLSLAERAYLNQLRAHIKNNWILPEFKIKKGKHYEAVVVFKISASGHISNIHLEKSSGNSYFDTSVIRAIERSNPFFPFPAGSRRKYMEIGIKFNDQGEISG